MSVNVAEEMQSFIRNLLTDRGFAAQYAEDPRGTLAAEGVTDHDLSGVDVPSAVQSVCGDPGVSQETRSALQSYTGGSSGPAHSVGATQSVEQVVQHLNYVTYQTYEGDDYITNMIDNSVDNSVDVDVDGNVFGDVDVDAVTGEQGQIIDGDNFGQANTGDGAVQAGDDASGVNTGVNTGINAGDDVENAVVGNNNESAQISGSADQSAIGFGEGDVTNLGGADIEDSAVGFGGGDTTNVSDNTVDDGSAIAVGGNASGTNVEDNDTTVTTTVEDNDTTISDNDTTVSDNDTTVSTVEDNDTITSGDDTEFATQ